MDSLINLIENTSENEIGSHIKLLLLNKIAEIDNHYKCKEMQKTNIKWVLLDKIRIKNNSLNIAHKELDELKQRLSKIEILDPIEAENCKDSDYDVVLNIDSMKNLKKGYRIEINNPMIFEECRHLNCIVIGVIGNFNKGKSFFLRKLTKFVVSHGYSNTTKGISIKYSKEKNQPFAVLDSAGFETPLKTNDKSYYDKKNDNQVRDSQLFGIFIFSHFKQKIIIIKYNKKNKLYKSRSEKNTI